MDNWIKQLENFSETPNTGTDNADIKQNKSNNITDITDSDNNLSALSVRTIGDFENNSSNQEIFEQIKPFLDEACEGLSITPKELFMRLHPEDIEDVLSGEISIEGLRIAAYNFWQDIRLAELDKLLIHLEQS